MTKFSTTKFLAEVIRFLFLVGLFYFISIPIFDFIAPTYANRFELAWSVSMILAIIVEKLYEIKELLTKKDNTDD
jgi:hypothetical protein